ncbi:MAG TPA: energy-coupling factor transporter ATPase [Firmicutes bacterium]|nr:energy-coupling factor transporter ATPase [Bacillota bacterium]
MSKDFAIEVKNVDFSYQNGVDVLKNISFNINKGEYVTLIGHNGSGKSTLAKLMAYLIEPNSGEIYINGLQLKDENIKKIRSTIGIVFQNPDNQFIGSTVQDDIAFGLENRCVPYEKMHALVKEYAKKVDMEKYLDKEPSELSGGQKQRVAIAGILALGLKVIIFDEATSMLDPEGVEDIKKLIFNMKKSDPELTFISITHDIEEAYLSDRVIILNKGKIFKEGNPIDVFDNEEDFSNLGLDLPFALKLKKALLKKGINIPKEIKSIEELSTYLCR